MNHFFKKLERLYIKMDKIFAKAASHYGFQCNGCEDNCCKSFFYHHTFVEKDYLLSRANELTYEKKESLKKSAKFYLKTISINNNDTGINTKRPMCPLNNDNKCMLYTVRPMICRLHGIPHHLNIPEKEIKQNPGCDAGAFLFNSKDYFFFDRIPYYKEMAEIEKEYKKNLDNTKKIKQTIAHMLLDLAV